jgi:hypothetical protein
VGKRALKTGTVATTWVLYTNQDKKCHSDDQVISWWSEYWGCVMCEWDMLGNRWWKWSPDPYFWGDLILFKWIIFLNLIQVRIRFTHRLPKGTSSSHKGRGWRWTKQKRIRVQETSKAKGGWAPDR